MRGIRLTRRGIACLVRGTKGGPSKSGSGSSERFVGTVVVECEECVVLKFDCGAGAVEGRTDGLGSGGSRDVVRSGKTG